MGFMHQAGVLREMVLRFMEYLNVVVFVAVSD
jgi:hypothetical protein